MPLIQLATDNFIRGSYPEDPMGQVGYSDAGNWSLVSGGGGGSLQVASAGACQPSTIGTNSEMYWSGSGVWSNDQYSELTIGGSVTGTDYYGPGVRMNATTGYVVSWAQNTNIISLFKYTPGYALLGNFGSVAAIVGDVIRLTVIGSSFTFSINGGAMGGTITDSSYASGNPGIYGNGSVLVGASYSLWAGGGTSPSTNSISAIQTFWMG